MDAETLEGVNHIARTNQRLHKQPFKLHTRYHIQNVRRTYNIKHHTYNTYTTHTTHNSHNSYNTYNTYSTHLELWGVQMPRVGDIEVSLAGQLVVAAFGESCDLSDVRGGQLQRGQERGQLVVWHVSIKVWVWERGEREGEEGK